MSVALESQFLRTTVYDTPCADRQTDRIRSALGLRRATLPAVDGDTLARYYEFLSASLRLPFVACYPEPRNPEQQSEYQIEVLELIDPALHLGDGFDGIFCKTRKGIYELNLPLIDLHLPQDDPNFQLIEDYWYWFWNWR